MFGTFLCFVAICVGLIFAAIRIGHEAGLMFGIMIGGLWLISGMFLLRIPLNIYEKWRLIRAYGRVTRPTISHGGTV
jgi:hypothetical protein